MFGELLSSRRPTILESLSDKALKDWVSVNAGVGVELEVLLKPLRQLSLEMLMETLSENDHFPIMFPLTFPKKVDVKA